MKQTQVDWSSASAEVVVAKQTVKTHLLSNPEDSSVLANGKWNRETQKKLEI